MRSVFFGSGGTMDVKNCEGGGRGEISGHC